VDDEAIPYSFRLLRYARNDQRVWGRNDNLTF